MQRTTIRIRGNVQRVGLRARIAGIADKLGVCGMVENLSDGSVLLVCEAEQRTLDEMVREIKKTPEPAAIKDMTIVETSPATGMSGFRVVTHDMTEDVVLAMREGTAQLRTITEILSSIKDTQIEMRDTQIEMRDTQIEMRDTQIEMRDTLKSIDGKTDVSLNNDAQILDILRDMRAGGMLRIPK